MKAYTFFRLDPRGGVDPFEIELFDRDIDACNHARRLLSEHYIGVEVLGGAEPFVIERETTSTNTRVKLQPDERKQQVDLSQNWFETEYPRSYLISAGTTFAVAQWESFTRMFNHRRRGKACV